MKVSTKFTPILQVKHAAENAKASQRNLALKAAIDQALKDASQNLHGPEAITDDVAV
jgi:hypothetical protein